MKPQTSKAAFYTMAFLAVVVLILYASQTDQTTNTFNFFINRPVPAWKIIGFVITGNNSENKSSIPRNRTRQETKMELCKHSTAESVSSDLKAFNESYQSFVKTSSQIQSPIKSEPIFQIKQNEHYFILDAQKRLNLDGSQTPASPVQPILLLNLVMISVPNVKQRMTIRKTWGNPDAYATSNLTRTVFVCGLSSNEEMNKQLRYESYIYNDIVQADFMDTYYNLTYKTLVGLKWATSYYDNSSLKFILKIDDDVVPNAFNIINYLNEQTTKQLPPSVNSYLCLIHHDAPVVRDLSSKFYVMQNEFVSSKYPAYCDGPAYLMTTDVAQKISSVNDHPDFFKFEDVYVTGVMSKKFQATQVNLSLRYLYWYDAKTVLNSASFHEAFYFYAYTDWNLYLTAWQTGFRCNS